MTIHTIKGDMEEALLDKKDGFIDNEDEHTTWVEYYLNGELVHRSAHVILKKLPAMTGEMAIFG